MNINWRNLFFVFIIIMVLNTALASVGAPALYQVLIAFAVTYGSPFLGIPVAEENAESKD